MRLSLDTVLFRKHKVPVGKDPIKSIHRESMHYCWSILLRVGRSWTYSCVAIYRFAHRRSLTLYGVFDSKFVRSENP